MAWKKEEVKTAVIERTVPAETNWESSYPGSLDRWTKDLNGVGYVLDAEYDLGDKRTLYRFKNDKGLFQNVVIPN